MRFLYGQNGLVGFIIDGITYTYRKNLFGDIIGIFSGNTEMATYVYDAWGNCTITKNTNDLGTLNPFRYRGYYWDSNLGLYYLISRYYDPQTGRFINSDTLDYLDPQTLGGLNLYAYCGNNPINFSYSNANDRYHSNNVGGLIDPYCAGCSFSENVNTSPTARSELIPGWLAKGLDIGSTIHGLYTSISGIVNHVAYFAKNLTPFIDDMTMLGASMKDGVLAFNQFSWGLGKADVFGIALGVGLDIYDSIQRGVSPGGVVLGATLTAAKGAGLIYLNKGIMYGATALGSAICPGVGTVVGFVVGGIVCIFVDIFAGNWIDDLIDRIAK